MRIKKTFAKRPLPTTVSGQIRWCAIFRTFEDTIGKELVAPSKHEVRCLTFHAYMHILRLHSNEVGFSMVADVACKLRNS